MVKLPDDIFVVVTEGDGADINQPLVLETSLSLATKQDAVRICGRLGGKYGKTKIGRVVFSDIDQVRPAKTASELPLPDNTKIDGLLALLLSAADDLNGQNKPSESQSNAVAAHMRLIVLQWIRTL